LFPKAAWRFASRRSPKSVVAAQAALGLLVSIRDSNCLHVLRVFPPSSDFGATSAAKNFRAVLL
jgi:hypothetical protein